MVSSLKLKVQLSFSLFPVVCVCTDLTPTQHNKLHWPASHNGCCFLHYTRNPVRTTQVLVQSGASTLANDICSVVHSATEWCVPLLSAHAHAVSVNVDQWRGLVLSV